MASLNERADKAGIAYWDVDSVVLRVRGGRKHHGCTMTKQFDRDVSNESWGRSKKQVAMQLL